MILENISVGVAGWSYPDWRGCFYPRKAGSTPDLGRVVRNFDCVEINLPFYRTPERGMAEKWLRAAEREGFTFTSKVPKGLTHEESLDPALMKEVAGALLAGLAPLIEAGKLGAILLQFPFYFRNTEETRGRVATLAERLEGWPCAIEVRDRSWLLPAALEFLRDRRLSLCDIDICQTKTSIPPGSWTTGPLGYVRFHGRNRDAWFDSKATVAQKYDYLYSKEELAPWAERVREIAEGTEATYVIMNNHFAGKAVANAFHLHRLLGLPAPEAPPHLPA